MSIYFAFTIIQIQFGKYTKILLFRQLSVDEDWRHYSHLECDLNILNAIVRGIVDFHGEQQTHIILAHISVGECAVALEMVNNFWFINVYSVSFRIQLRLDSNNLRVNVCNEFAMNVCAAPHTTQNTAAQIKWHGMGRRKEWMNSPNDSERKERIA